MKTNKPIFTGSGVALVTPFDEEFNINYQKLRELIDFHLQEETDAIIITGTTGEASTMTDEEQLAVVDATVKHVNGKIPVIAGCGSNDTRHGIELSKRAAALGVDGLLIVTPYYNKTSQQGLIAHYKAIAKQVMETPIILYNVPSRTGMSINPETYLELSKIDNIVATKEASGDLEHIKRIRQLCSDTLDIYSGNDDQIADILDLNGIGVISVLANILPDVAHCLATPHMIPSKFNHYSQEYYNPLVDVLFMKDCPSPIAVKEAMNLMGMEVGEPRLPLIRMDIKKQEILKETLSKFVRIKER